MPVSLQQIEGIAPDQPSLKAASKLMKPGKWPLRGVSTAGQLIWGECQGSGANPYRVMADVSDPGYKCTCPSRKFPCKHSIALMWMFAEGPSDFVEGAVPEWVTEWMGRRRNTGNTPAKTTDHNKNISAATAEPASKPKDPKAEARKKAAAEKRATNTRESVSAATIELEQWIADQLRGGLAGFISEATDRCRRIAARLVDAKAQSLAGRIDELPSRIAGLDSEERLNRVISELGQLVLLVRAWRESPDDPALHRSVISAESTEQILQSDVHVVASEWEVLGERISTRKDGLVSQATWLLNLAESNYSYALLLDFFPATLGKRASSFTTGEQFAATLKFYPAPVPQRALITERSALQGELVDWPDTHRHSCAKEQINSYLDAAPWAMHCPVSLSAGRICETEGGRWWWQPEGKDSPLPLVTALEPIARGAEISSLFGVWNGARLDPIAAVSQFGRLHF